MPKRKVTKEGVLQDLKSAFRRLREIYTVGCKDPSYRDGVNLDLVRNHIIYDIEMLDSLSLQPWEYPIEYFYPIPPKFPDNFTAVDRFLPVLGEVVKSNRELSYNEVVDNFNWREAWAYE